LALVFRPGALKSAVESALASQQKRATEEASEALTTDACEVRFTVVSQTAAIQFKTAK